MWFECLIGLEDNFCHVRSCSTAWGLRVKNLPSRRAVAYFDTSRYCNLQKIRIIPWIRLRFRGFWDYTTLNSYQPLSRERNIQSKQKEDLRMWELGLGGRRYRFCSPGVESLTSILPNSSVHRKKVQSDHMRVFLCRLWDAVPQDF